MKILDEQNLSREVESASFETKTPEVSVFLPVYNEEPNLMPLHAKLDEALNAL